MQNEALKLVRQFHNLSLTETASRLSVSKSYLSLIENGHKKPTLDLVEAYAKAFNMPVSQLMLFAEGIGDPKPSDRIRRAIAGKAIRMLQWLDEISHNEDGKEKEHV